MSTSEKVFATAEELFEHYAQVKARLQPKKTVERPVWAAFRRPTRRWHAPHEYPDTSSPTRARPEPYQDVLLMPLGTTVPLDEDRRVLDDRMRLLISEYRRVNPSKSVKQIMYEHARRYGVAVKEILGYTRRRDVSMARQAAMFWAIVATGKPNEAIGALFQRDHATIIHAIHKMRQHPEFECWLAELQMGTTLTQEDIDAARPIRTTPARLVAQIREGAQASVR